MFDLKQFKDDILIPLQNNHCDPFIKEYNAMLLDKLAESHNELQFVIIISNILSVNISDIPQTHNLYIAEDDKIFVSLNRLRNENKSVYYYMISDTNSLV